MGYKLLPPGTRHNNATWIVRGTVGGRRFEARSNQTTKTGAERWAIEYVAGLTREAAMGPVWSFAEAATAYCSLKRPRKLDQAYIDRLVAWFRDRPLAEIVGADLITAAHALQPRASDAHKNRAVITPASSVLHYAAEQGWCNYKRFRRLKVSRRSNRKPASVEDVRLLLANADGPKRLLLAWLYETGMRITDSVRLSYDELDLQTGRARLRSSKNDDVGNIALSPELVAMFAVARRYPPNRAFPWNSRHSVYKWLRPLCKRLGVSYTPHMSRHALATDLRALGWDMRAIAERGIWRDERSAGRYVHRHSAEVPAGRSVGNLAGGTVGQRTAK